MTRRFTAHLWREGDLWVAQGLEVDVASQGEPRKRPWPTSRKPWSSSLSLVSQSAHFCAPTPHQDEGLGLFSTSPTIPKGWA